MRGSSICYGTGFINKGVRSREPFDPAAVQREMQIIRDDLPCNTIRITGGDPERREVASVRAGEGGPEVWFLPVTCGLTAEAMLTLLADCAERAARLGRGVAERGRPARCLRPSGRGLGDGRPAAHRPGAGCPRHGPYHTDRGCPYTAHRDHGLVFQTVLGTPIDPANLRHVFRVIVKQAELGHLRFHDLRHTYGR